MRLLVIPLLLATACGASDPDGAGGGGGGAANCGGAQAPLELQIVRWEDGELLPVGDGSTIPLVLAPQGGHFVWVAARVKNLSGRDVDMNAVAQDAATGMKIGEAVARPLMSPTPDGFWDPEHDTFTTLNMVQICPHGADFGLDGRLLDLTLQVKDVCSQQSGNASVQIRPDCGGDGQCECECDPDYAGGCS